MKDSAFLIQHKEVQKGTKSHSLNMAALEELRRNAIDEGRDPMYMIDNQNSGRSWVMIEEWILTELREVYLEHKRCR